jgi:hypothetical protein
VGSSPHTSKKLVTKLGDAADDSSHEAEFQDDMVGNRCENIVRTEYKFSTENTIFVYLIVSGCIHKREL